MRKILIILTILMIAVPSYSGDLDLSSKILDAIKSSIGVIESDGYETHIDDLQVLDTYGIPGWMYVSISVVNAKERKAEIPFRVITNGQYIIPMLGAIIRTDTKENILSKTNIVKGVKIPVGGTLLYGTKSSKTKITVFSDIFCDLCKDTKNDILEFIEDAGYSTDEVALYERYAPIGKDRMFVTQMYEVIRKMDISPSLKKDLLAYLSNSEILEHPTKADMLKSFLTQIEGMTNIKQKFESHTKTDGRVATDILIASKIGVKGVPFTVINGIGIKGYEKDVLFEHLEQINQKKGEDND